MKTTTALGLLTVALIAPACSDAPTAVGTRDLSPGWSGAAVERVTVMTQNLYVGADVDAVLLALMTPDPSDDLPALSTAITTLQQTDFATRAGAIADAIAREQPHVVGVQEVSDISIDLTGLGLPIVVEQRFLQILDAALAARGLPYAVAAMVQNFTAEPVAGVRLVDSDAILVDTSRATIDFVYTQNFSDNLGPVAPGVVLRRGFVEVAAIIGGRTHYFVNTHLEPDIAGLELSGLRAAQARELVTVLGDSTPAFIMGDLNDTPGSAMYRVFEQAGFHDVWAELRPGVDGFTNPRSPDLANPRDELTKRIDYIWARGVGHPITGLEGRIDRVGEHPSDRVAGPYYTMWTSDHTGLVAELVTPRALGVRR